MLINLNQKSGDFSTDVSGFVFYQDLVSSKLPGIIKKKMKNKKNGIII